MTHTKFSILVYAFVPPNSLTPIFSFKPTSRTVSFFLNHSVFHRLNFYWFAFFPLEPYIFVNPAQRNEDDAKQLVWLTLLNVIKNPQKTCLTENSNFSHESSFFERPPRMKCSHLHWKTICTNKKLSSWAKTPFGPWSTLLCLSF